MPVSRTEPEHFPAVAAGDYDKLTELLVRMPRRINWAPLLPKGLRLMEVAFLRALEIRESFGHPSRISDIADELSVSRPTATNIAALLHRLGYIEKSPSKADRRTVLVSLTAAGKEAAAESRRLQERLISDLIAWLGEEDTRHLVRILTKLDEFFALHFSYSDDAAGGVHP